MMIKANYESNTVTEEMIDEVLRNSKTRVETVDGKCTVVTVTLENGFMLTESSACVDKKNYVEAIGRDICLKKIKDKIWELEGYKLQCELFKKAMHPTVQREETPKERVERELKELEDKKEKLDKAIWVGIAWNDAENRLLHEQYTTMAEYASILRARLSIWRDDIPKYDKNVGMVEAVKECDK